MAFIGLNSSLCLTYLRQQLSDTDSSGNGRWTDDTLYNFIDRGNKRIVGDVFFPDSRVTQPTVIGQQAYQFPLLLKTYRIYVAGQKIWDSDINTLEGQQIEWTGAAPQGQAAPQVGSFAPEGTTGPGAPPWLIQEPISYPSGPGGGWGYPAPDAQPWAFNDMSGTGVMAPRFAWMGGYLLLTPPPANVTTISVDCVRQPDTINGPSQVMTTPDNFLDAIVAAAAAIAWLADDGARADVQRQRAEEIYMREKKRLVAWRWGDYEGQQRHGPKPLVLRPAYGAYHVRRGGRGVGRGGSW